MAVSNRFFTILIVPERHGKSLRWYVGSRTAYLAGIIALLCVAALAGLVIHYTYILGQEFEARHLRSENQALKTQVVAATQKLDIMEKRLLDLSRLDDKLRAMTALADQDRGLATGPSHPAPSSHVSTNRQIVPFASALPRAEPSLRELERLIFDSRLLGIEEESKHQGASLTNLVDYFGMQKSLLASTPSIWPAIGFVTSHFGVRGDPYTGERMMHYGVDIAAPEGAKIVAPAGGRVTFVGQHRAYGLLVAVDHGRGIVTHFAHLRKAHVKLGDAVHRGKHIADIGNSGRSTGPHLHYEVRQDGVPVDPRRFVVYN